MESSGAVPAVIPLVDYLHLDDREPYLTVVRCTSCGARFFDRRNACASCGKTDFESARTAGTGTVRSFTIVHRATPDVEVPFTSAVVELDDGKTVKANLVGLGNDAEAIAPGLRVELTTWPIGHDSEGTLAVTFGFKPTDDNSKEMA